VDRDRLDHQAEGLIVINAGSLDEATKNPASIVPVHGAIRIELVLHNPLAGDDVGANGARDKISGVVGDQGSKLFFHGTVPVQIDEDDADEGGHR
jgi:hypothetical protein